MDLSPKQIVSKLDKYIIGQDEAKRAVAIALRNRYRRAQLPANVREEITPKNIIMKGPTGVGKTEIARRLAKLVKAPFVKVEATKYTEVGYVGRDVESMVRDLMASAISLVRNEMALSKEKEVEARIEERLLDLLLPSVKRDADEATKDTREKFRDMLRRGVFDNKEVDMAVSAPKANVNIMGGGSMEDLQQAMSSLSSMFSSSSSPKLRKISIKRAREIIKEEEMDKVIDNDKAIDEARERTQEMGIIFIDEIDKVASRGQSNNADVSREGVQRDILPIVEGSVVNTKYGVIHTDYILFIAAGAFHIASVSDLIPELQGRFPIQVELNSLDKDDFKKILTIPQNAITTQYTQLLKVDNIDLEFTEDAIDTIAELAADENETKENIGARRLQTIMEMLLEDISFNASDENPMIKVTIDRNFVLNAMKEVMHTHDFKKYVL